MLPEDEEPSRCDGLTALLSADICGDNDRGRDCEEVTEELDTLVLFGLLMPASSIFKRSSSSGRISGGTGARGGGRSTLFALGATVDIIRTATFDRLRRHPAARSPPCLSP